MAPSAGLVRSRREAAAVVNVTEPIRASTIDPTGTLATPSSGTAS